MASNRTRVSPLVWILVVGIGLRLVLWLWFQDLPPRIMDELHYNQLAVNLTLHGEFGFHPGELTSIRPPLYPFLVSGVYTLFGLENYQAVRLLQIGLSLLLVLVVYALGVTLFSRRVGLWAAGICCFYPSFLAYNNLLLTEILFTLLLCSFCLILIWSLQRSSVGLLALAGIMLGLAALTRSVLWLFPPILAIYLAFAWRERLLGRLVAIGIFVLSFSATLAPWTIRNTLLQETFVTVDVMGGRNFMMGNYQHTPLYRSWDAISIEGEESWSQELKKTASEPAKTQGKLDKLAFKHGLQFVLAHPFLTLQRDIIKFFDFWGLEREIVAGASQDFFGPLPKAAIFFLAMLFFGSYAVCLLLGIFGFFLSPPKDWRFHCILFLIIAFICGMHTIVFGHSRYHLPLMPLIFLFTASAMIHGKTLWEKRGQWSFRAACGVCCVVVFGWVWLMVAVDFTLFVNAVTTLM